MMAGGIGSSSDSHSDDTRQDKSCDHVVSDKGTVRGIKNRVRSSLASIQRDDKTVVMKILQNHMLRYELRDVSLHKDYQKELSDRMVLEDVSVPQVFADGAWLGDMERIRELNETGELARLLSGYSKIDRVSFSCDLCGGFRYVPCSVCNGTKKSPKVQGSMAQLRCSKCDKQGLVRCAECTEQQE